MILEDAHGNYIDRKAYEAAYGSLVANGVVKHAQVRDEIAQKVVVTLMQHRAAHGPAALATAATASEVADQVRSLLGEAGVTVPIAEIADAAMAAGHALSGER